MEGIDEKFEPEQLALGRPYTVHDSFCTCTCAFYLFTGKRCKHYFAVQAFKKRNNAFTPSPGRHQVDTEMYVTGWKSSALQ
jgi:predicted nucleic acid-binding Zn finger protein